MPLPTTSPSSARRRMCPARCELGEEEEEEEEEVHAAAITPTHVPVLRMNGRRRGREGKRELGRTELTDDEIVMDGYWRQDAEGKEGRGTDGRTAVREGDDRIGTGGGGARFQIKLLGRDSTRS